MIYEPKRIYYKDKYQRRSNINTALSIAIYLGLMTWVFYLL